MKTKGNTYNDRNFAVHQVASTTSVKPELKCVAFFGDRTVATDSFSLLEVSAVGSKKDKPHLVPKHIVAQMARGAGDINDLFEVLVENPIDKKYPDVDQVFDEQEKRMEKSGTTIRVNAKYLANICRVLQDFGRHQDIKLTVIKDDDRHGVLYFSAEHKDGQKARGLLMGMSE